jgi:hypothetical protein
MSDTSPGQLGILVSRFSGNGQGGGVRLDLMDAGERARIAEVLRQETVGGAC